MKTIPNILILLGVSLSGAVLGQTAKTDFDYTAIQPGSYDGTWWNRTPIRLIQTNFPAVYASMAVDDYVDALVDASANTVLFNTGGIVANYQTKLDFQYRNPHMGERDFVGELIEHVHEKDIKYIARFDFSKLHPSIADKHPEWLYVGTYGQNQTFNGLVSTCINGAYYQEHSLDILKEAIETYPLDGIFFNMMGYTGATYSGEYHGICQCGSCKRRFKESTGLDLPTSNDDSHISEYRRFQQETSRELYTKVTDFIKATNPNLIIYNYNDVGTSWIASESGGTPLRNGPEYIYNATNNVKQVLGSYKDVSPVNLTMGFLAIGYRNIMNNPNLLRGWMLENMLHGAPLGFVVVGTLNHYEDRVFLPKVKELYTFHKTHEPLFTNVQSVSNIALIQDRGGEDARGMIRLASEEHLMYDIINPSQIGGTRLPRQLEDYELVILNNVAMTDKELATAVSDYVKKGGKLLVLGSAVANGIEKGTGTFSLETLGVASVVDVFPKAQATYLKVSPTDQQLLSQSKEFSLMMMNARFLQCELTPGAKGYLRLLPTNLYGPAEVTWYEESQITQYPGVVYNDSGEGKTVFIPWDIGAEYEQRGNYAHRSLLLGTIKNLLSVDNTVETDMSPTIELTRLANRNGQFEWMGMINHSGFLGNSVREPITITNTSLKFKPLKPVKQVRLVNAETDVAFKEVDGWIECTIPRIADFEMLLCLYE
ncbi:alpha-amylase family protein [Parapedobacter koreensis]|uniref:Hypothetical glycosyl hydrolase 6 n=1 Tax=Parapedobacter koreensis TaxID=332977 RepID=A0A1H7UJ96_9SPHI|nr:alpha-amylase family protein [Parapedobacter koreensis]SEL96775.1 Hypothetical glycosyl hydrolase 6 [Parapedobacter koreensis]